MTLTFYFFRQFIPPFVFGFFLFLFVLLLDKLFDIIDLVFNKGVSAIVVAHLFSLFIPTVLPLTLPMAILLACIVTFGRLSEENELTAVRAAGISLKKVLWLPPLLAFFISLSMLPFNSVVAPKANSAFRAIYQRIASADPLINVEAKRFFNIKNIKLYAESVDKDKGLLENVIVYQLTDPSKPADRIYARRGAIQSTPKMFQLHLESGQMEQFDASDPNRITHTAFEKYTITLPINLEEAAKSTRFRNLLNSEIRNLINDLKQKKLPTAPLEAEYALRGAIAFAPFCLAFIGIPLATTLKRGGKGFSTGVSIVAIFVYYLFLILGLTLAEKGTLPAHFALWLGNILCLLVGTWLLKRMLQQ